MTAMMENITQRRRRIMDNARNIAPSFFLSSFFPSLSREYDTIGTIDVPIAPSPKSLRKRFGSMNASPHADIIAPPPNIFARKTSLTSPSSLHMSIAAETPELFFRNIWFDIFFLWVIIVLII